MSKQGKQGGADGNTRVLRWAAASALIGVFLIYNSVDAASQNTPAASPTAAAPASEPRTVPETEPRTPPRQESPEEPAATPQSRPGPALPRSPATHLDIPSIGVSAPFTELSLDSQGTLIPPPDTDNNLVGWYKDGPSPGERGNAIVAGHVDTKIGPAVFYTLSSLKVGGEVNITREDGIVATFTVDKIKTFKKNEFPDRKVYGDTPNAQLRLITCGGAYDHDVKDYTANVVAFAHLTTYRWA
ncbi:class F sortase [Streptomyces sp. NA02950]|uniref:class F sortase n=1 Tax=Streptomyces sp. NA02950 TaxID=2742137 RepID=UPI001591222C|nr:class F sortase [Streptomyces sp. NA02950]QKV91861.1 class F sortase [Streptomyces sp. NA02950]